MDNLSKMYKELIFVLKAPPIFLVIALDTAADSEGYYNIILGEQLDGGRYQVFSSIGKGIFANVVRARILKSETGEIGREVAIKIIRCQESMSVSSICHTCITKFPVRYRVGQKETLILNKLKEADPEDKKHLVAAIYVSCLNR
jgi:serine/threonine-protein kinase PRP4